MLRPLKDPFSFLFFTLAPQKPSEKMKNTSNSQKNSFTLFLFLLSIVLSILAMLQRKPEALTKPQFWAEDGAIFFRQSFQLGSRSFFVPYAGYLHLIPRIVAYLTLHGLSYRYTPLGYNLANLLLFLGLVCFIWRRTDFDPYIKFFMTLALSLVPVGSEMVFCLTNVQWYTGLFIPLFFLAGGGNNRKYARFDGIILFLVGLSGPFSLIFLPAVCAIVWFRSRKLGQWNNLRPFFVINLFTAFIQLLVLAFSGSRVVSTWSVVEKIAHSFRMIYLQVITPLGISSLYVHPVHYGLLAVLLLALLRWTYLCWRRLKTRMDPTPLFLMLAAFCAIAANVYSLDTNTEPYLNPFNFGMRYFFGPCVLFFWSVFAYLSQPGETAETTGETGEIRASSFPMFNYLTKVSIRNLGFVLLYAYYTVVMVLYIPVWPMADKNWPEQAKKIENLGKGHLEIPINPDFHWTIILDK